MDPILERYQALEDKIKEYNPALDAQRLFRAFTYADNAHAGQLRKDGSPYITHPIAVAEIVAELGLDMDSIIAAMLHDCIEDTESTHDDIAKRFSLAGVLDEDRQAKQRFPVEEIEVAAIEDHPANVAYSMDEDGIKSLAESIRKDGLTDIPMVRRKPDGGFQMLSGHRRKAAYALLAKDDPAFGRMPCRIVEGVSDDQAVTLLHTANYFTRELNVIERAKATQALGIQVERMRAENPELKGVRTAELKAAIIRNQPGRNVSPATIKRQEQTARRVEQGLTEDWRSEAIEGNLSDTDIATLGAMDPDAQARLYKEKSSANAGKADTSKLIREAGGPGAEAVGKLVAKALKTLRKAAGAADGSAVVDASQLDEIERCVRDLRTIAGSK